MAQIYTLIIYAKIWYALSYQCLYDVITIARLGLSCRVQQQNDIVVFTSIGIGDLVRWTRGGVHGHYYYYITVLQLAIIIYLSIQTNSSSNVLPDDGCTLQNVARTCHVFHVVAMNLQIKKKLDAVYDGTTDRLSEWGPHGRGLTCKLDIINNVISRNS